MASAEELAKLIESTVRAVLFGIQGAGKPSEGHPGNRKILDPTGVSRVDAFTGKESQWREWACQLRVAIKAMSSEAAEIMARSEVSEDARKLEDLKLDFESLAVTKVAGELYDLLGLCLKGDPLILVQGVTSMRL